MGRHRQERHAWRWATVGLTAAVVVAMTVTVFLVRVGGDPDDVRPASAAACERVKVVTSTSFAPVVARLAPGLGRGRDCIRISTTVVDGRSAAGQVAAVDADVWIPDDAAWTGTAPAGLLAGKQAGAGTVVATSPIYLVSDRATTGRLQKAGGTWKALAEMLTDGSGLRLAVRDPGGSGDGLVAAGSLGEAVWLEDGMDASSLALTDTLKVTRTVTYAAPALPTRAGEVGLVPEYALLGNGTPDAALTVSSGKDRTALLRYSWQPTTRAAADPTRAAAVARLLTALTGPEAAPARAAAQLRAPDGAAPPPGAPTDRLPSTSAEPFDVLGPHQIDHVLATWYPTDRDTSLLIVVDVSGSMRAPAPGSRTPLIDLVRQGCRTATGLLPDQAAVGLWEFGSRLSPPADHRVLVPTAPLRRPHRAAVATAVDRLTALDTGTGLYDTILAAYTSARDTYRSGRPNQVVVFTDGSNKDDPGSITDAALSRALTAARDPKRPVALTVIAFGSQPEAQLLVKTLKPVDGYVDPLTTADQVAAVFVHLAAGGLHG